MIHQIVSAKLRPYFIAAASAVLLTACGSPEAKSDASAGAAQPQASSSPDTAAPSPAKSGAKESLPTVGLDSLLQTSIYDNGFMALSEYDLIFAPQSELDARAVIKSKNKEVASFGFFPNYRYTQSVFGRMQPENHAEHQFTPGDYVLEFYVSGDLATRLPFEVVADEPSDDPFNPEQTMRFKGPWQDYAYFTFPAYKDEFTTNVSFWGGSGDLPAGQTRAAVNVKLKRNGKLVAHSKLNQGMLDHEMARRHVLTLFQPHERKGEANAELFSRANLEENGNYKLTVELTDDNQVIREFDFKAKGGKLVAHPRTELGYKPRADYIAPRVIKLGTTTYEFVEAYWMVAK